MNTERSKIRAGERNRKTRIARGERRGEGAASSALCLDCEAGVDRKLAQNCERDFWSCTDALMSLFLIGPSSGN